MRNKVSRGEWSGASFSAGRGGGAVTMSSAQSVEAENADQRSGLLATALPVSVLVRNVRRSMAVKLICEEAGYALCLVGALYFTTKFDAEGVQGKNVFFAEVLWLSYRFCLQDRTESTWYVPNVVLSLWSAKCI